MGQAKPQDIQVAAVTMMMSVMIMTQDNVPYRKKPPPLLHTQSENASRASPGTRTTHFAVW